MQLGARCAANPLPLPLPLLPVAAGSVLCLFVQLVDDRGLFRQGNASTGYHRCCACCCRAPQSTGLLLTLKGRLPEEGMISEPQTGQADSNLQIQAPSNVTSLRGMTRWVDSTYAGRSGLTWDPIWRAEPLLAAINEDFSDANCLCDPQVVKWAGSWQRHVSSGSVCCTVHAAVNRRFTLFHIDLR